MLRLLVRTLAVVLLLAVVAVVADRVMHRRAEQQVADQLGTYLEVTGEPDVSIEGIPFLTQLLAGELDRVVVTAPAAAADGVELTDVSAEAHGVRLGQPVVVGDLRVSGTLPEAVLQRFVDEESRLDLTVAATEQNLSLTTEVLGLDLSATAEPQVEDGALVLQVLGVELAGARIDADDVSRLVGADVGRVDLGEPELPLGLRLTGARPDAAGLVVDLAGTDVPLEQ